MFDPRLEPLKTQLNQYWAGRALYQIEYAHELAQVLKLDASLIEQAIQALLQANAEDGAITQSAARQVEAHLAPLSSAAKRYQVICAAHAHIDMNWMWRWDETVAITLDTFRTMLSLMQEYPQFTFSQSQASVYQIVEQYAPEMLEEIRQRVRQGRWEVTAATWVEADKNLPSGESQARHLLYTRRYLSRLLDLKPENFLLDFEPDTFGHHSNVPEILASGGVKYYYHCRGDQSHHLFRWLAPSGKSILVYREPTWYLGSIEPTLALHVPAFCHKVGMETMLKVYGVGDHGGGPTRRDIERLLDMDTWPVFPHIRCGTFGEYFALVEKVAPQLPSLSGELNFVFTGCYTSQSRIKRANRLAEAALGASETFSSLAALQGTAYPAPMYAEGWQNTLFNQFHDIIPGSGVIDTREYALGLFQKTMAIASSQKSRAFHALAEAGKKPAALDPQATSEGAGVGFGVEDFRLSQVSRGAGLRRLFHVFNPCPWPRQQVVELVVWDWPGDLQRLQVVDEQGAGVAHQILDKGWNPYWGHNFLRVLAAANAPACGYGTLVLQQSQAVLDSKVFPLDPRIEQPLSLHLENEHLSATFDSHTCALVSLVDKASGKELVDPQRPAAFRRIQEDVKDMTAWVVGRYMTIQPLSEGAQLLKQEAGPLRQSFTYQVAQGSSKLTVTIALDAGSRSLDYRAECDWHEIGRKGEGVPQLNFCLPLAQPVSAYRYDIPFGVVERPGMALDVPGNSWGAAIAPQAGAPALQLITEGNYGFRGDQNALALTLIRSSYDPDPYPESGIHKINFAIHVAGAANHELVTAAADYTRPLDVFSGAGAQAQRRSFITLESDALAWSALKAPEDGAADTFILRFYEVEGRTANATIQFSRPLAQATWCDAHEQALAPDAAHPDAGTLKVEGSRLTLSLRPYGLGSVRVQLAKE